MNGQDYNLASQDLQDTSYWQIVNDAVMGGLSTSDVKFTEHGVEFIGTVRLENNGGFCMLQFMPEQISIQDLERVIIEVKAAPKTYQLRLKSSRSDYYNYYQNFDTTGEWQRLSFNLADFKPQYRGRLLNKSNFKASSIAQISFLIGNKRPEDFSLTIKSVSFQ